MVIVDRRKAVRGPSGVLRVQAMKSLGQDVKTGALAAAVDVSVLGVSEVRFHIAIVSNVYAIARRPSSDRFVLH
jgi:hypothetical protein